MIQYCIIETYTQIRDREKRMINSAIKVKELREADVKD